MASRIKPFWVLWLLLCSAVQVAQAQGLSLGFSFFKENRMRLRAKLPSSSMAVLFAAPMQQSAGLRDVLLPYHQDPDFYYFTGITYPRAVLVVTFQPITFDGKTADEFLFLPKSGDIMSQMIGLPPAGHGFQVVLPLEKFDLFCKEWIQEAEAWKAFTKPTALQTFEDFGFPSHNKLISDLFRYGSTAITLQPLAGGLYAKIAKVKLDKLAPLQQEVQAYLGYYPQLVADPILQQFLKVMDYSGLDIIQQKMNTLKIQTAGVPAWMNEFRQIKGADELSMIQEAVRINVFAVMELIKAANSGRSEKGLAMLYDMCLHINGLQTSIPVKIASGERSAYPMYMQNNSVLPQDGIMVISGGAEYSGYQSVISRTIPLTGKFSGENKKMYQFLLAAHQACIASCIADTNPNRISAIATDMLKKNLTSHGILKSDKDIFKVLKGAGIHPIGLDVYDPEVIGKLKPGMVVVVETGVYFAPDAPVDTKWKGHGYELKDMVLITAAGPKVLSGACPAGIDELELLMPQNCTFEDLPILKPQPAP